VELGRIGAQVTVTGLIQAGLVSPQQAAGLGAQIGASQAQGVDSGQIITLKESEQDGGVQNFNVLAYMAPGMALMFLMFTVSHGGRTLLVEKKPGNLATPAGFAGQHLAGTAGKSLAFS
jgi:ABC-2 type transport system permease protein